MPTAKSSGPGWRCRRVAYYALLFILFASIAFYFGPNRILFGKWTWITAEDIAADIPTECVPVVRAMKEYQRDHGKPVETKEDLVPDYLPTANFRSMVHRGEFLYIAKFNHFIEYDFSPGHEGWRVIGPFIKERLSLPPVTIDASTRPTTRSH